MGGLIVCLGICLRQVFLGIVEAVGGILGNRGDFEGLCVGFLGVGGGSGLCRLFVGNGGSPPFVFVSRLV